MQELSYNVQNGALHLVLKQDKPLACMKVEQNSITLTTMLSTPNRHNKYKSRKLGYHSQHNFIIVTLLKQTTMVTKKNKIVRRNFIDIENKHK